MKGLKPICPYCQKFAVLVKGTRIYPHRPDLALLNFWECAPCDAYVGCHQTGDFKTPLGRLANAELRSAKIKAHAAFDPIWKARWERKSKDDPRYKKQMARNGRYKRLAELMGISRDDCHIGMFSVEQCMKAIEICEAGLLED